MRQLDTIATSLPTYQKLGAARHKFREDSVYSLFQIAELVGISHHGIRHRALRDKWPTVKVYASRLTKRTPRLVDGAFLRKLQLQAKEDNQ